MATTNITGFGIGTEYAWDWQKCQYIPNKSSGPKKYDPSEEYTLRVKVDYKARCTVFIFRWLVEGEVYEYQYGIYWKVLELSSRPREIMDMLIRRMWEEAREECWLEL